MSNIDNLIQKAIEEGRLQYQPDGTLSTVRSSRNTRIDWRGRKFLPNGDANSAYTGRHGRKPVKIERAEFIAVDGEAESLPARKESITLELPMYGHIETVQREVLVEEQNYTLLATSTGRYIYNKHGLATEDCFRFLLEEAQTHSKAIFVGFGFRYDVDMMLRDIETPFLRQIGSGERTFWHGYQIHYIPGKLFHIIDHNWSRHHCRVNPSITVYDTLGFFQGGLVSTIKRWWPECPDLQLIEQGKAMRSHFGEMDNEEWVRLYNDAENRALVEVMNRLYAAMREVDCVPRYWYGAGAYAAELMNKYGVRQHMARTKINSRLSDGSHVVKEVDAVPKFVREAALHAFAGGRIEAVKVGNHQSTCWRHDLNSAYPWALPDLPSLANGYKSWKLHNGDPREKRNNLPVYALYLVEWNFDHLSRERSLPFYPFFFRSNGGIYFPHRGRNWVWGPEVIAAIQCGLGRGFKILRWISYNPPTDSKPFGFVTDLAAARLRYKAAKHPAERPLKLGLNSIYGKTAQTIGAKYNDDGELIKVPSYYQPEWSGYITSKTRAAVFQAAMQDPDSIIGFMTDGIFTEHQLNVQEGENLGEWEVEKVEWLTQVQSGIYWYKPADQDKVTSHYRGFDPNSIDRERVLEAYRQGIPVVECTLHRFVGLTQALHHTSIRGTEGAVPQDRDHEFRRYWRTWRTAPRILKIGLQTGKRASLSADDLRKAANQLISTKVIWLPEADYGMSEPVQVAWTIDNAVLQEANLASINEEWDGTLMRYVLMEQDSGR